MTEAEHEEMRLKRIQEKNRRNQRKFRARQRVRYMPFKLRLSPGLCPGQMTIAYHLQSPQRQLEGCSRQASET